MLHSLETAWRTFIVAATFVCVTMATAKAADTEIPDLTKGGRLTHPNARWGGPIGANLASCCRGQLGGVRS